MIMNRNPLALAGTAERLAMNEVNRAAVVAGDPERAARVAAYDRARRTAASGPGTMPRTAGCRTGA